jgi:dTDP-4-dehydrorhamnose reductase
MIVLLGGSGYVGREFAAELKRRGLAHTVLSRAALDYTCFDHLLGCLRELKPEFLINAAGYTGKPNVDACETARAETIEGNILLPQTIAHACVATDVPWGHVSSGCIFTGAKIAEGDSVRIERDLTRPEVRDLVARFPERVRGFTEMDAPNFSFRCPPCSFYSGSKALAEDAIAGVGRSYIWRLRVPFDEHDSSRNFLSKLQRYGKVYDNVNSLSHLGDYARACLDLWRLRAPFGTYNVTNPGFVITRDVVTLVQKRLRLDRPFEFFASDEEFYRIAAKTPRSNCVLDVSKMISAGVVIRPINEALEDALGRWQPGTRTA